MNLHPITLLFILILAAFFYSQGFLFFFFATLVIGFLLLIASLTASSASGSCGGHGHGGDAKSVYPEKMTIQVKGELPPVFGGEKAFAEDVVGGAGVVGRAFKAIWNFNIQDKPKKNDGDGEEKKANGGHG